MSGKWESSSASESYDFSINSNNYEAFEQPVPATDPIAPPKQPHKVLVTKLKEGTTLAQINAAFKEFGELDDIAPGETQSEVILQFTSPKSASAAMKEEVIHCGGKTVFMFPHHEEVPPTTPASSKPFSPPHKHFQKAPPPQHNPHDGYSNHSQDYYHKPSPSKKNSSLAPSKPSSYHKSPSHHSGDHYQSYHQSVPPKHYQQAFPPQHNPYEGGSMHSSQAYYHTPAPSKQQSSPPHSSNHYPSGYYPAEQTYSLHSHEEYYHHKPQHHHSPPPPKNNHYQQAPSNQYHQGPPYHSSEHYQSHHHHSPQPKHKHYQQAPSPKHNHHEGSSMHYPSGYGGGYTQPPKEVNYSSKSTYGGGSGGSNFTKNTGPKVDGVTFSSVEKQKFVDLCFMFDATGSMGPHIALTVHSIKDIFAKTQKKMKNRIIRLAYVVYRDYPASPAAPVVEYLNFTQNVDLFMTSLSKIQAVGGGDTCEDVVSSLKKVQELEWSSNTRILFWIADAPCHGEQFHDGLNDAYAKASPKERPAYSEKELLGKLKFHNIRNFFFLKINNTTDKMVGLFKGMYDSQGFELKQEPITGNKEGFVNQVVGSVMYSINFHAALH